LLSLDQLYVFFIKSCPWQGSPPSYRDVSKSQFYVVSKLRWSFNITTVKSNEKDL